MTRSDTGLSSTETTLFAWACGATVANIYYAQSLVEPIARDLHLPVKLAGMIVTTTQLGYGIGLFLLVCLGDLLENRRLILVLTATMIVSLLGVVASRTLGLFLLSSFLVGLSAVGTQLLVPLAAHLTPEAGRGRVIGNIMGGLIGGIMLSRPLASFLSAHFGWRAVFIVSIAVMLVTLGLLWRALPSRQPTTARISYGQILLSILHWLMHSRPLQRRAAYQGAMFCVFNLFWTAVPIMLHARFGLSQQGIALFALAGAGGALAAPYAGRIADRGHTRAATGMVITLAVVALLLAGWGAAAGSLAILVVSAVAFDATVQTNQVLGQRVVYGLNAEARGRLNAGYMTILFACGAFGSALGSITYVEGGWWLTMTVGAVICAAALALFATERHARVRA